MKRISAIAPFDSSVGRAEDCRCPKTVILRSLFQFRLEGCVKLMCAEALQASSSKPLKAVGRALFGKTLPLSFVFREGLVAQRITRLSTDQNILGSSPS